MRKRKAVMGVCLVLLVAAAIVRLTVSERPNVLFVTDSRYASYRLDTRSRLSLQAEVAAKGWTLSFLEFDAAGAEDAEALARLIRDTSDERVRMVVMTPLATASLARTELYGDDFAKNGRQIAMTVGMGRSGESFCDVVLVTQTPDPGWEEVARSLAEDAEKTPLPSAVLYSADDRRATEDAALFMQFFDAQRLESVGVEGDSERQAASVMARLSAMGVGAVAVPFVQSVHLYANSDAARGMRWIVDASVKSAIPDGNLGGVVEDDLAASVIPLLETAKTGSHGGPAITLPMARRFRGRGKGLRNWF